MRAYVVYITATVATLVACSPANTYRPESNVNEMVVVTASPAAIRGLEADLRKAIQDRRGDTEVGIGLNESSGPPPRTVDADSAILNAAFEDARRKARALAGAVHATLGDAIAVDEVNAADAAPPFGNGPQALKGVTNYSRVTLNRDMPEIVRVTFALASHGHGPASITVYGLHAPAPPAVVLAATQLNVNISAQGDDALKTVAAWEALLREAARRNGARDADIRVGNVNANFPRRAR